MSGYDPDLYDDELDNGHDGLDDLEDRLQDSYDEDPVRFVADVITSAAGEVEARVQQRVETEVQQARGLMAANAAREANEAMQQAYGAEWEQLRPVVAEKLKGDWAAGRLPYHDSQALAETFQTHFLAERERSRPSRAQQAQAAWERVKAAGSPVDEYLGGGIG